MARNDKMPNLPSFSQLPANAQPEDLWRAFQAWRGELEEWSESYAEYVKPETDVFAEVVRPTPIPVPDVSRLVGADGVLVQTMPDRHIVSGESDPVGAETAMSGGGEGGRELLWGVAVAPAARTESGTDAPAHIIPASGRSYVYVNPSDSDGTVYDDTLDPLAEATADQYVKIWWRGDPNTINVRGTNVVSYIESEGEFWLNGDGFSDAPIWSGPTEWCGTKANVRKGWIVQDDDTAIVKMPSVDVDTDGDPMDLDGAGHMQDCRQRIPVGSGDNPDVDWIDPEIGLTDPPPISVLEYTFDQVSNGGGPNEIEIGVFIIYHIVRVN